MQKRSVRTDPTMTLVCSWHAPADAAVLLAADLTTVPFNAEIVSRADDEQNAALQPGRRRPPGDC
jgi:hypothetical protein